MLGKQKQHVQGRMTSSKSKLMVGNRAIGEEEGFDVRSDDGVYDLADDWEQADWSLLQDLFCTFFLQSGNAC